MDKQGVLLPPLPVVYVNCQNEMEAKDLLLRLNSHYGKMTKESVLEFIGEYNLDLSEYELPDTTIEFDLDKEVDEAEESEPNKLTDNFLVPPFSILDSKAGYWQDRKRMWKSLGLKSDEGRDVGLMKALTGLREKVKGDNSMSDESIFDPVLCEVLYTWFCKSGGYILDPFTGGSVRGVVAGVKGMNYTGFDIRKEQIEANEKQRYIVTDRKGVEPVWICNDSAKMNESLDDNYEADFIFSCPPYADLEVYSDLDGDISNMEYDDFMVAYKNIIKTACSRLKNNRFACFVVGEVRDKKTGKYKNFVGDTIQAFTEAGLSYYNEIIFATSIATVSLVAGNFMKKTRKVGKIHQNVLVFVKGDPKVASSELGDIEVMENIEEE